MIRLITMSCALTGLAACQTVAEPRFATLEQATPETMETVTGVLASAVGRAEVQLGPGDLTQQPVISVLPPPLGPLEGSSPAMPEVFDLVLLEGVCFVRRRQDGEMFELTGVTCRAVE